MALVVYFKTSREYLQEVLNSFREKKPRLTFAVYGIVCTVMLTALVLSYAIFLPHHGSRGTKHVVIVPGMGSRMIGAFLKQEGVIGSKWAFVIYVSLRGDASDLKPGAYEFPDTAAIPAIARDLVAGESRERIITIPEGWSNADIAEYFELQGIAGRDEAMSFMKAPSDDIVSLLEPLGASRKSSGTEGYLFPDTYRIFRDAGLADITGKMVRNFDAKVTQEVRDAIAGQQKSIFEIVTMASLIEKEVSSEEDRALVSGILWKRISLGMPLQVDATIAYIKNQESRIRGMEKFLWKILKLTRHTIHIAIAACRAGRLQTPGFPQSAPQYSPALPRIFITFPRRTDARYSRGLWKNITPQKRSICGSAPANFVVQ